MIRYTLRCDQDHEFEAWFGSSAAYDRAAAAGENCCPVCGSANVEKAIMAPAIGGARPRPAAAKADTKTEARTDTVTLAQVDPRQQVLMQMLREFRQKVTENADYVGGRFADEARKIHYGEAPSRGIYGEATSKEARELAEEGIPFHPLPPLPEKAN